MFVTTPARHAEAEAEYLNQPPAKAFLLYVGQQYYPGEAVEDLICSGDTVEELKAELPKHFEADSYQWWCIVRHSNMTIVEQG